MFRIKKDHIDELIKKLSGDYLVFAPVKTERGTEFEKVDSSGNISHGGAKSDHSPKSVFFPQSEVLFKYSKDGVKIPEKDEKPYLLWGVKNCDTKSIRMLDKVFGSAYQAPGKDMYKDPYWKQKYDSSIIFNFACNEPLSTCFCNWFESGPFDEKGSDVFVVEGKEYLYMKGVSEKGSALLEKLSAREAPAESEKEISELEKQALSYMTEAADISKVFEKLPKMWQDEIWAELTRKCINCGACAFICPSCHCFDVSDEGKNGKGKRVRLWDSCMLPIFTKEASGHNPRGSSVDRVRQRVMHKFSYFKENYGSHLCTGCGRCVTVCPVNFDIREVIKTVIEHEIKEKVSSDE